MRLNNGSSTSILNWGPGYNDGPITYAAPTWYHNRGIKITNNSGKDVFLPENSTAEKNSVYRAVPFTSETGNYYTYLVSRSQVNPTLRKDVVAVGAYCWNGPPSTAVDPIPVPGSCPEGYIDIYPSTYKTYGPLNQNGSLASTYIDQLWTSTVSDADWFSTYGVEYNVVLAGGTTASIFAAQSLRDGYFWQCSPSYPYQWIAVRVCYKSTSP